MNKLIGIITKLIRDAISGSGISKGEKGDDDYQIAVRNGFVGTEAEWLKSLEGKPGKGVPPGGTVGQVLKKKSANDYDADWENDEKGGIGGTPLPQSTAYSDVMVTDTAGNVYKRPALGLEVAHATTAGAANNRSVSRKVITLDNLSATDLPSTADVYDTIVKMLLSPPVAATSVTLSGPAIVGPKSLSTITVTATNVPTGSIGNVEWEAQIRYHNVSGGWNAWMALSFSANSITVGGNFNHIVTIHGSDDEEQQIQVRARIVGKTTWSAWHGVTRQQNQVSGGGK